MTRASVFAASVVAVLAVGCITGAVAQSYSGIGDQLAHTFLKFDQLPLTVDAASEAGWQAYGTCDPSLGQAYRLSGDEPTDYHPIEMLFTNGGQIAGVTVYVSGDQPIPLIPNYWVPIPGDSRTHKISVVFRGGFNLCGGATMPEPIGDRVVVNPDTVGMNIPLTNSAALDAGFFRGGCISGMGTHWGYDIYQHPAEVFNATTALPVVPMYDGDAGRISAFLIMTPILQEAVPVVGDWEGPFIASLLCYNYCSSSCASDFGAFSHTWNTMHFMLHNHKLNKCAAHCASDDDDQ